MSTVVYQNLVSCFESQFKETTTTVVKLKLAPPTHANFADFNTSPENNNWGSFETNPKEPAGKSFYTQYPSPSSRLSAKSLELCTENLGSESGSDIITDESANIGIFACYSSPNHSNSIEDSSSQSTVELETPKKESKSSINRHQNQKNITKKSGDFPPPLTTMCAPGSLQMRRRSDGDRLFIDAVEAPFRNSYLQAERSDGRLRLCFMTTSAAASPEEAEEEEEEEGSEKNEREIETEKEEIESDVNYEVGIEKFQRLISRCKESGHGSEGLCSVWKPTFCVAT